MKLALANTALYGKVTDHPLFEPIETAKQTETIEVDPATFAEHSKECSAKTDNPVVKAFLKTFLGTPILHIYQQILPRSDCELSINRWTFMSIDELMERAKQYHGRFYEIAVGYLEMGYVVILLYCPKTNMFFFHVDGGQDHTERVSNHAEYLSPKYDPSKFRKTEDAYTTEHEVLFPYNKLERSLSSYLFG